jgi:hypothetical protein
MAPLCRKAPTDYKLLSGPRQISTASLQPNYLRPFTLDLDPMDAPLVGGSSPVRPGSAISPTKLPPPPPPWPAHLSLPPSPGRSAPSPLARPGPSAEGLRLPSSSAHQGPPQQQSPLARRHRPRHGEPGCAFNRDLAAPGTPLSPRVLKLDVPSSSRHANFHLRSAARQREQAAAEGIAKATEAVEQLKVQHLDLSERLKCGLAGPARAELEKQFASAAEQVRLAKRRLRLAQTLREHEDSAEARAFQQRAADRHLSGAPWTFEDQRRLDAITADEFLARAERQADSLRAWDAGKDIEAMAAAREAAEPPPPRPRSRSPVRGGRGLTPGLTGGRLAATTGRPSCRPVARTPSDGMSAATVLAASATTPMRPTALAPAARAAARTAARSPAACTADRSPAATAAAWTPRPVSLSGHPSPLLYRRPARRPRRRPTGVPPPPTSPLLPLHRAPVLHGARRSSYFCWSQLLSLRLASGRAEQ